VRKKKEGGIGSPKPCGEDGKWRWKGGNSTVNSSVGGKKRIHATPPEEKKKKKG